MECHSAKKVRTVVLLLLFGVSGFLMAEQPEAAIHRILDRFEESFLEKDLDMIDSILAEDWVMATPSRDGDGAHLIDKTEYLRIEERRFSGTTWLEHRHANRRIEIRGPIATSKSTIVDRTENGPPGRRGVYHVYALLEGEWKVVFTTPSLAD